jgi:DNA-binding SARP family transcriptional activator/tetratricopeptide (TPR) repeat protein/TolB-like protein
MLRLLTLGGLSLVEDGVPVTGAASQRSRLALLAVLAAAGPAGVSRDKVLALLWPESDDERARHALKQSVYALRRDLGNENAIVGTAMLSLDASVVASDLREFEDAIARGADAEAIALYAGPFLDGVFIKASPEFDQWAANERSQLARAHIEAIGRLAHAAETSGDVQAAVQWWRRAAAAEPMSGRVTLSLMRALANSGDVSAAIQHARVHDAIVRSELDSPADDAVLAFAEQLRRGEYVPPVRAPATKPPIRDTTLAYASPEAERVATTAAMLSTKFGGAAEPMVIEGTPFVRWRQRALATFAVMLGLGLAATQIPSVRARVVTMLTESRAPRPNRRIVVATFENQTGDPALDPYGELASDWLARTLLEADFVVVDSRTSATITRMLARITPEGTAHDRASALASQTAAGTVITGRYYLQGDSLQFEAKIVDPVRGVVQDAVGPIQGPKSAGRSLVATLANRVTAKIAANAGTTPGASTASLVEPPSAEAFEHTSRAWEMFFANPSDTAAVFAELARASATDSTYTAPLLMRAYVLDVKEQWAALAQLVKALEPRRTAMQRTEREAMALYESDLRGDLAGRLRASRELLRLHPGSADMALLVAVSASYLNHAAEAHQALIAASPDSGINQVSPMYWAWRAMSEHALGRYEEELLSARQASHRFPASPFAALAFARAYAALGQTRALDSLLARSGVNAPTLGAGARPLALLAARELRAHGHDREAATLFTRISTFRPPRNASKEDLQQHALALYESGDYAGARAAYTSLAAANPGDLEVVGRLGAIAARLKDSATVKAIDERLSLSPSTYDFGKRAFWRAHLAALTGRGSDAVALLQEAIGQGYRPMDLGVMTLHDDGDFANLWMDSEFRALQRPREGGAVIP